MANYENNTNKVALNRSFSFSGSPIIQKVSVEQSFQNKKGETLIRHYSCEQICDHRNKQTVQFKESLVVHSPRQLNELTTLAQNSSISETNLETFPFTSRSSHFNFHKNCPEQEGFQHSLINNKNFQNNVQECMPMEVDTSMEDNSMSDVHSLNMSDNDEHRAKISKLILPPTKNETKRNTIVKHKPKNILKHLKLFAIFFIPVACAFILMKSDIFANEDSDMKDRFQGENITNALQDLVYGQQDVITKIKEAFSDISENHVFVFVGSVGVGKTYTANIISKNYPWKNNVKIVSPQHISIFKESNFVQFSSRDHFNLVIVDDLKIDDNTVIPFVKKMLAFKKKIVIILIYTITKDSLDNIQQTEIISNSNIISESLSKINMKHSVITFNKLGIEVIRKCIRYSMAKKGLIINQYNIEHVLQNLNYEYSGCKKVYSKVAMLR